MYQLNLTQQEVEILVKLLEFAESEISRTFKRFSYDDEDMKEIYWSYRYQGRQLRRKIKEVRGY